LEGEGYRFQTYSIAKPQFRINGGKGAVEITLKGPNDIYFKKYDEHITVSKFTIHAKNIIWGGLYVDLDGTNESLNHKTGERVVIKFHQKSGNKPSYLKGEGFDASGKKVIEISGSWLTQITIKDLRTGVEETAWEAEALVPDAHLQYFFGNTAVMMNQFGDGMQDMVSPTDSRFRQDLRLYEEGQADSADEAKILIEEEQRRKRAHFEETGEQWEPRFFRKVEHPFLRKGDAMVKTIKEDEPVMWELIEGENGYWERRKRGDWADMPRLWDVGQ
jgi:oxysterol-binding protein-related protein 3/6/7